MVTIGQPIHDVYANYDRLIVEIIVPKRLICSPFLLICLVRSDIHDYFFDR